MQQAQNLKKHPNQLIYNSNSNSNSIYNNNNKNFEDSDNIFVKKSNTSYKCDKTHNRLNSMIESKLEK